ncbi:S16 family serine protease [Viridibacillus sp. NPDC096237]|uniref:S16 family serine protease n=1 Tax=Viridibacillus sp. NPDC096237 TaxID=3390721 RepID=UPI003D068CEE
MTTIITLIYYFVFLLLYLKNVIGGVSFVVLLLLSLIILLITLIVYRKKRAIKRKVLLATTMIALLFCYELPLLFYDSYTHAAYRYTDPLEVYEGSGIYLIGVNRVDFQFTENKNAVINFLKEQQIDFLDIIKITNSDRYGSKNRQLLKWFYLGKDSVEQMRENVNHFLGQEDGNINKFLNNDHIDGSSAGLGLALTGLILRGDLHTDLKIAVTGAINETGDVLTIGILKEKMQIAEKSGFSLMIIPSANRKEALEIQQKQNLNIQILDVSHVDEAARLINELNDKTNEQNK